MPSQIADYSNKNERVVRAVPVDCAMVDRRFLATKGCNESKPRPRASLEALEY
jgi:hypothetical protein